MIVNREMILNGQLSANGLRGVGANSGGGAGGSVYLVVGRLTGNGKIQANGGNGDLPAGGGGAGGRITVDFSTNQFQGNIEVMGGSGVQNGGAGSIFLKAKTNSVGQVLTENGPNTGGLTTIGDVSLPYDLTVGNGVALILPASNQNLRNLTITSNGLLTIIPTNSFYHRTINLNVSGHFVVDAGGVISLDGCNLAFTVGTGASNSSSLYGYTGGGGGHGGMGGASINNAAGGLTDGSITVVANSVGGRGGGHPTLGGAGGGHLRLNITSNFVVNGTITANGKEGIVPGSGGGAGGG
ncbi:MAG: hypothetical protein ACK4UN_22135, partial [Limisphaerales bacterium]